MKHFCLRYLVSFSPHIMKDFDIKFIPQDTQLSQFIYPAGDRLIKSVGVSLSAYNRYYKTKAN